MMIKKVFLLFVLSGLVISGCGKKDKPETIGLNSITVKVEENGKPVADVYVYISEMLPVEVPGIDILRKTDSTGTVFVDGLQDDMYQVWVTSPGYIEMRQRVPLFNKKAAKLTAALEKRALPEHFEAVYAFGTFNEWDALKTVVKLENDGNGKWSGSFSGFKGDSAVYAIFFDKPYLKYYDPEAEELQFVRASQPAYLSVAFPKGEDSLLTFSFDDSKFPRSSAPFLNQWPRRTLTGVPLAQEYIKLEKILADYYQVLSETVYYLSGNYNPRAKTSKGRVRQVLKKLNEYYREGKVDTLIANLEKIAKNKDPYLSDLAKVELAKIYKLYWKDNEATGTLGKVDIDGFGGGEVIRNLRNRFQGPSTVLASYVEKKLKKTIGRQARYELWNTKVSADARAYGKEAVKRDFEKIIEEFPNTRLAEEGRRYIEEN